MTRKSHSEELILTLASRKIGYIVNRHSAKESKNNSKAYRLHLKGYLTFGEYNSANRLYTLTESGKDYLNVLQEKDSKHD